MGIVTGIILYLVIWWLTLYAVLPWGIRIPEMPVGGQAPGAPAQPRLFRKALVTTGISVIIWSGVYVLIRCDVIDFRSIAAKMMQEDHVQ